MLHEDLEKSPRIILLIYTVLSFVSLALSITTIRLCTSDWKCFVGSILHNLTLSIAMRISLYAVPNRWLLEKAHRFIPHVVAVATGHSNWISFDMQIIIARYSRFISWRYKYSSSLLMVFSSPLILVIHRLDEYPFGFDSVSIGFDLTFVMSVSKSSDFRIINTAAFRFLLSVLVSD